MNGTTDDSQRGGGTPGAPRSTPIAAIAGAIVLAGLVGIALYRRSGTPAPPGGPAPAADPSTAAPADASTPAAPANPVRTEVAGTPIVAQAPIRLSPEANILAERYRCVCGCNDPLGRCTCRLSRGSEEMKTALRDLADQHLLPGEVDSAMTAKFGAAALLSNPAPPQTLPSHVTGVPKKKTP
jgi:hypothetical protein